MGTIHSTKTQVKCRAEQDGSRTFSVNWTTNSHQNNNMVKLKLHVFQCTLLYYLWTTDMYCGLIWL